MTPVPEDMEDEDDGEAFDSLGGIDLNHLESPLPSPRVATERETRQEESSRNVRPRLDTELEPDGERTPSLTGSNFGYPPGLPAASDSLQDLPDSLRRHFREARLRTEEPDELPEEGNYAVRSAFVAFMSARVNADEDYEAQEQKVARSIKYEWADPETQKLLDESRKVEWAKFERFAAAVPIVGSEKDKLLAEGHVVIPSQWIDVDKNEHQKGKENYVPKMKSRLVSCGNFEKGKEGLRSDSPTSDLETHHIVAAWAASKRAILRSADVTSAYFQALPLDRVLLMRQPRGGLHNVDPEALLLVRVPIYGLSDSGRGFWLRLDKEAKEAGFKASSIFPSFYFFPDPDEAGECVALMTTHVDDLLIAHTVKGREYVERLLGKFEMGSLEQGNFRYCGKQFVQNDKEVSIDVSDNTRKVKHIKINNGRKLGEGIGPEDMTRLRSTTGSLAWLARQGRPDLLYRVSALQTATRGATVSTLMEANKVVELAIKGMNDVRLTFPNGWIEWRKIGVLTVTDASFSGEAGFKSQQGRIHFLASTEDMKSLDCTTFKIYPISFSSTTIKRVCRATLQAEAYSLQAGMEAGDRIRALIAEMRGQISSLINWLEDSKKVVPHLQFSDCRSLTDHLGITVPNRVQDKRLAIELSAMHQSYFEEDRRTWDKYPNGGDRLEWIATQTMVADCLTKNMKPTFLLKVLKECVLTVNTAR